MKSFLLVSISFFFVSCGKPSLKHCLQYDDPRCRKLVSAATKKGQTEGVCYSGPLTVGIDKEAADPDPEKCKALVIEAQKKCGESPPVPE